MRMGGGGAQIYDAFQQIQHPTVHANTSNPLSLFLQTLMPWNTEPNAPPLEGMSEQGWYDSLVAFLNRDHGEDEGPEQNQH